MVIEDFYFILEIIGTIAFAASGAFIGIRKNMDIFGVCVLGVTTAVGGGCIRDIILGDTPPAMFTNPVYASVAVITCLIIFLLAYTRLLQEDNHYFDIVLFWMDTLGLGVFSVMGVAKAFSVDPENGLFVSVFVGVLTGVGGGLLRDMMCQNMPFIFVKQIYACASLIGALFCAFTWDTFGKQASMLIGCFLVVLIRYLAAHYLWDLPKAGEHAGIEKSVKPPLV